MTFFESELCKSGMACRRCRRAREYRRGVIASFDEPTDVDFACPHGKTAEDFPQDIEPNIFDMGVGFGKAMAHETRGIIKGNKSVSSEEVEARMAICHDCQFFVNDERCAKCGCFVRFKARLRTGACPIGKW